MSVAGKIFRAERTGNDRYRILLSDGKYTYAYRMLATQLNHLITNGKLDNFTVVQVNKVIIPGGSEQPMQQKRTTIEAQITDLYKQTKQMLNPFSLPSTSLATPPESKCGRPPY